MEVSNWQFAQQFEEIRCRAVRFARERRDVLNDKSVPLISWTGCISDFDWLCNPNKKPPAIVQNVERARPHEEFVCWLMLPINHEKWYFGRVYSRRRNVSEELRLFRAIASEAGSYLRRDGLFNKYLSPCVAHTQHASRFPAFNDHVDISYWCALLFARPDCHDRIAFPFGKTSVGDDIAEASIPDPFRLTADAIRHWRLNSPKPNFADGHVAPPVKWPIHKIVASVGDSTKRLSEGQARSKRQTLNDAKPIVKLGRHPQITIRGKPIALEHDHAIYVKALIGEDDWLSDSEFRKRHPQLGENARPDRWRKKLPTVVAKHITTTSRGSRWLGKRLP